MVKGKGQSVKGSRMTMVKGPPEPPEPVGGLLRLGGTPNLINGDVLLTEGGRYHT